MKSKDHSSLSIQITDDDYEDSSSIQSSRKSLQKSKFSSMADDEDNVSPNRPTSELKSFDYDSDEEDYTKNEAKAKQFCDQPIGYLLCGVILVILALGVITTTLMWLSSSRYLLVGFIFTIAITFIGYFVGIVFWIEWLHRRNRLIFLKSNLHRLDWISYEEILKICKDRTGTAEALAIHLLSVGFDRSMTLVAACQSNNEGIVDYVLGLNDASQIVNKKVNGSAAIHMAVRVNNPVMVEKLLGVGANPNIEEEKYDDTYDSFSMSKNKSNRTGVVRTRQMPLHIAAKKGNTQIIEMLLEHGADRDIKNGVGRYPWQVSKNRAVKLLLNPEAVRLEEERRSSSGTREFGDMVSSIQSAVSGKGKTPLSSPSLNRSKERLIDSNNTNSDAADANRLFTILNTNFSELEQTTPRDDEDSDESTSDNVKEDIIINI